MSKIDAIVREWLEENIQLVKDIHYGENAGAHEDDEDYQALKRVLDYMTPPGGFDLPVKPDPLVEALNEAYPYEMYGFDKAEAEELRAALAKRGLEIREKSDD